MMKTTWSIIKTVSSNRTNPNNISLMNINNNLSNDSQTIANAFNKYFLTTAENIITDNLINKKRFSNNINPLNHLHYIILYIYILFIYSSFLSYK